MQKKKILIFGMTSGYGGVESFIINYVRNMDREKLSFDFLVYNEPPAYSEEIKALGGKIIIVPGRGRNPIACIKEIKKALKETKYDAVWSNLCYLSDILVLKYAKIIGVPIRVIHAHNNVNMSGKLNGILHNANKTIINRYATHFWACSDLAGEFFYNQSIIKSNKYKVIPNAVDTAKFSFNPTIREDKRKELGIENQFVLGNVGRLHFQKNHLFLLEIFREVLNKKPDSVLLLIGEGELKEQLENKCRELGIADKVMLLGRRNDVSELMQAMDAFILPSRFEGLGIVLIEAQCSGLYCFASAKVVPNAAKVTDIFEFIDLNEKPSYWADSILSVSENLRTDKSSEVSNSGYNIFEQAVFMSNFFVQ